MEACGSQSGWEKRPDSWLSGTRAGRGMWRNWAVVTGHGPSRSGWMAATSWPGFGQYGEDFARDRQAMALSGPDLPVPRVLETGGALGGAYAISERCFGEFLEALDAPRWRRLLPALLRGLDALRDAPALDTGGPAAADGPAAAASWREQLQAELEDRPGQRVSGWRAALAGSAELDALFSAGERAVCGLLDACPDLRHVLHRDLLNRNVLVAADGSRLTAVFDWGCYSLGDFLYEVAWFTFWAPWHAGTGRHRRPVRGPRALPGGRPGRSPV